MSIKYAVLGLLHYRDMYGYEIKDHIEKNFAYMWTVNYGQIYASLKTLVSEGLIVLADVVPSENGAPQKKLYSLTDEGRKEFKSWLRSSPEKKLLHRDPFIMRFIFFGFGRKAEALKLVEEQIRLHEQRLAQREEELPHWMKRGQYVAMARELGISYMKMRVKWLHQVRDALRHPAPHASGTKKRKPGRPKKGRAS
jgi:DNA-binding PadR family transcriptional regulator